MGIKIEMPIRMAIFRLAELDKWRNGERENGYCRKLPGTKEFSYLGVLK
ncbi:MULTISPECIES: hypothetical protein [Bacillaceae]|nr:MULTISPECIES: hypothetical protein [Bacillaceae]MCK7606086.1 hypothetical protein [Geobacillus stearothermophilus]WJQ12638.1 hypothetical protein QT238_10580 [Geobacillus stearothermophilus]